MPSTKSEDTFAEAEGAYSNAAKAELDKHLDRAFRLYLKAAEAFLHLSQVSADHKLRTACQAHAGKALERAEKIKAVRRDLTPVPKDHLSQPEQLAVLRRSSIVNNTRFPLWGEDPGTSPEHTSQPALCAEQRQNAAVWQRLQGAHYSVHSPSFPLLPEEIIQHIVADCSVCGSIAVCVNHNLKFSAKVGLSSLFPQASDGSPIEADTGHHYLRILFNGAYRRIKIDDELPTYPDGTLMCMSTGLRRQLWPSLVEKAYMKLMGGYEFPGSNSSADLHALTGWIPEYIGMKRPGFQRERTWSRIMAGYAQGSCMLTLGTGSKVVNPSRSSVVLLPAHCYAVVDIQDSDDDRRMTILDPWVHQPPPNVEDDPSVAPVTDPQAAEKSRTSSLSWDAICTLFDGVYLSWDPGIFQHQLSFHGSWQAKHPVDGAHSSHLQLRVQTAGDQTLDGDQEVWVLLTRHMTDTRRKAEFIALLVKDGSEPLENVEVLALKGEYTDGVHVLVKAQMRSAVDALSIVASYEGNVDRVGFTVTTYSHVALAWRSDCAKALFMKQLDGMFTSKNAGGNQTFPSFFVNPQYHLRIHPSSSGNPSAKAHAAIVVKGSRNTPMNATAVWSSGERIAEMGHNDVALTSGPYSYGYARAKSTALPVGDYTVVVSTFEPQQLGPFAVEVESNHRFDITPIPQEGAGMYSKVVRGDWTAKSAGGSPSSNRYSSNPAYEIHIASQTQLKMRLQLVEPSLAISMNVSLFHATPQRALVATSGPYSDAVSGVVTPLATLVPGTYLAVPSTYNPGVQRAFRLIVYSTSAVRIVATAGG